MAAAPPHLVVLLSRGARQYRTAIRDRLHRSGFEDLPRSGSWLLAVLSRTSGTIGELAIQLGTTKQSLSRMSDAMVERGYLRRTSDRSDHRLVRLSLTARGRAAAACVLAAVKEVDRSIERRADGAGVARAERALRALFGKEDPA